jgi:hypothetical protein
LDGVEPEIDQDEHEPVCGPPLRPPPRPRRRRRPASRRSRSASQASSKDGRICLKPSVLRPVSVLNMRRWREILAWLIIGASCVGRACSIAQVVLLPIGSIKLTVYQHLPQLFAD